MTKLEILYRSILLNPYDDVVRHAYADLHEEEGRAAQAKYLRKCLHPATGPQHYTLIWPVQGGKDRYFTVRNRRGFIEWVGLTRDDFLEYAQQLFSKYPLTGVTLHDVAPVGLSQLRQPTTAFAPFSAMEESLSKALNPIITCYSADGLRGSMEEAQELQSAWCVAYGRYLADLPPLDPNLPGLRNSLPYYQKHVRRRSTANNDKV